ncbi:extracellular serine/threonine protein CG31145-like [Littorina saxatilis]|uniref:FAM20 C-terminal domain-containing protein n=1 Tax=Littorina saxatilis TaxID=31220 RepID=A0AAN9BWY7_9CAEN
MTLALKMVSRRCVRWRTLAVSLLAGILVLNVFIFVTLPTNRQNEVYMDNDIFSAAAAAASRQRYDSRGISHLQFPRKRLNKSNFTSDSRGGGGGGGGGGGVEDVGDHPPLLLQEQRGRFDPKVGQVEHAGASTQRQAEGQNNGVGGGKGTNSDTSGSAQRANFTDPTVDAFVKTLEDNGLLDVLPGSSLEGENYWDFLKRQRLQRKAGMQLPAYKNYKSTTNWERFHTGIRQHFLYDPDKPVVDAVLSDLTKRNIIDVEQKEGGTQIKLIITYDDEGQALFKPMRYPRETETLPDHFYFADYERHIAEIAAFHLDRVLGFNRVPPVAGRKLNMTHDIRRLAESKLARTFFISPAGNLCFHGSCSYYCDSGHPICGHPDMLEASMMAFLPPEKMAHRQTWRNPWKRSYSKHRKAYWEVYDDLCEKVKKRAPYNKGRRLLDIVDMSVMDFMMGNLDRHHYETFRAFGNDSFIIHLDHGRGFGKAHQDEMSCLAPMLQCCRLRRSTLQRLVRLYRGPYPFSVIVRTALSRDSVNPVLIEPHLEALDRRLVKVLRVLAECAGEEGRTLGDVVVDDGVY